MSEERKTGRIALPSSWVQTAVAVIGLSLALATSWVSSSSRITALEERVQSMREQIKKLDQSLGDHESRHGHPHMLSQIQNLEKRVDRDQVAHGKILAEIKDELRSVRGDLVRMSKEISALAQRVK